MGALSALGRGTDLQGNRFTGLLDMIDGGGGGKSGDKFAGGGLLSMLGNLFAKPYEAQQRVEDIANRASTRNVTPNVAEPSITGNLSPRLDGKDFPMQYSGRGNVGMPREGMEYSGRSDAYMPSMNVNVANDAQPVSEQVIFPSDAARVDAQNQANRDRMRQNMSTVTREQYDQMSRQERAALGLPVGGLDLTFAGADAFAQPMQYSGRGISSGDPQYDAFVNMVKDDPAFSGIMDNPVALRNIFNMYKQQMGM